LETRQRLDQPAGLDPQAGLAPRWRAYDFERLSPERSIRTDGTGDLVFERITRERPQEYT